MQINLIMRYNCTAIRLTNLGNAKYRLEWGGRKPQTLMGAQAGVALLVTIVLLIMQPCHTGTYAMIKQSSSGCITPHSTVLCLYPDGKNHLGRTRKGLKLRFFVHVRCQSLLPEQFLESSPIWWNHLQEWTPQWPRSLLSISRENAVWICSQWPHE